MTANAWQVYDVFWEQLGNELHDFDSDTFKVALLLSGYTPATATDVTFSVIDANEHANGNGYTTGGETLGSPTWAAATGTLTFDTANVTWTASGGSITARYAVVYNSSAGGTNDLICYCLLDNTPADVTSTDGNTFSVNINASGLFSIAQS